MIDLGRYISAGDGVWWGQGGAEPEPLVNALLEQAHGIGPIRAFCGLTWNDRLSGDLPGGRDDVGDAGRRRAHVVHGARAR